MPPLVQIALRQQAERMERLDREADRVTHGDEATIKARLSS